MQYAAYMHVHIKIDHRAFDQIRNLRHAQKEEVKREEWKVADNASGRGMARAMHVHAYALLNGSERTALVTCGIK